MPGKRVIRGRGARRARSTALAIAVGVLVAVALAVGVRRRPESSRPVAQARAELLSVELAGCAAIVKGPACELTRGAEVRLWIPSSDEISVAMETDRGPLAAIGAPEKWSDGIALRAAPPADARVLRARSERGGHVRAWEIELRAAAPLAPWVERARALRKVGQLDEARDALESAPASERATVVATLARVEFARGNIPAAESEFRESIDGQEARGRLSDASDDAFALVHLLLERRRFGEARELMTRAATLSRDYPSGRANGVYYRAFLARAIGDLRGALREARAAHEQAVRLALHPLQEIARQMTAVTLTELGRTAESVEVFENLLASDTPTPCERARLLDDIGWAKTIAMETGSPSPSADPRPPIDEALVILRKSCPDPSRLQTALLNLAQADLDMGFPAPARASLAEARRLQRLPTVPVVLSWLHLEGRIELALHQPATALSLFERESQVAVAVGSSEEQRVATEDRAASLIARDRKPEALRVLEEADTLLVTAGEGIPLGEGRGSFFAARDRASETRMQLLLSAGRPTEAMHVARRMRARALRGARRAESLAGLSPAARARWEQAVESYRQARDELDADAARSWEMADDRQAATLAQAADRAAKVRALLEDALAVLAVPGAATDAPPPPNGELVLTYAPAGRGWLGFAEDASGVVAKDLGRVDESAAPTMLAAKMLEPFRASLASATRLRALPYGALRRVDLHALPWNGQPLLAKVIVTYGAEGEGADSHAAPRLAPSDKALLVIDPLRDLPGARAEGAALEEMFTRAPGWSVALLRGDEARSDRILASLGSVTVLHYAGHGIFGGPDGLESALPLAAGGTLTPGDILAMHDVPPYVALFGCETNRDSVDASDALGLARAFLVAGSQAVIGASRIVDDRLALDMATELYSHLLSGKPLDFPRALRDAQLATRARAPLSDWAAFRALTP